MPDENLNAGPSKNKFSLSLDYRLLVLILVGIIIAMLVIWKPWNKTAATDNDRTITVSGEAKVKAEPDEFVFNPNYQFKGEDKAVVLSELTKKSEDIVAKLKELGVQDNHIKTNTNGNEYYTYYYDPDSKQTTYNLSFSITVGDRKQAQKIQDYLVSTNPAGAVSPQATFSDNKRKELESQARDQATKEARAKADQSAKNLGFKVGSVKSVQDGAGFGITPMYDRNMATGMAEDTAKSQLAVQPGENDLTYSVTVVYFLR